MMTSFVNIFVTAPSSGQKIPLTWGDLLHAGVDKDGDNVITNFSGICLLVQESPEEIAALVQAEIRKQHRREIATQVMQGLLADPTCPMTPEEASRDAISYADALLDALEGGTK